MARIEKTMDIFRWDGVTSDNGILNPLIYVKPDIELMNFYNNLNGQFVKVVIMNTNSNYDNLVYNSVISSVNISCNEMNYLAIRLTSNWFGYPTDNGIARIIIFN